MIQRVLTARSIHASTVVSFLSILGILLLPRLGIRTEFLGVQAASRMTGATLGLLTLFLGNALPKLRALHHLNVDSRRAQHAERSCGWLLVGAGLLQMILFVVEDEPLARLHSAHLTIGVLAASVVLVANALFGSTGLRVRWRDLSTLSQGERHAEADRRNITYSLYFAGISLISLFAVKSLFGEGRNGEFGPGTLNLFWTSYALLWLALGVSGRRCRKS